MVCPSTLPKAHRSSDPWDRHQASWGPGRAPLYEAARPPTDCQRRVPWHRGQHCSPPDRREAYIQCPSPQSLVGPYSSKPRPTSATPCRGTSAHLYGHSIPTRSCPPLVASSDRWACLSYLLLWRFSQSPQAPHSWRARSSAHPSSWEPRASSPLLQATFLSFDQQQGLVPRLLKPIPLITLGYQRVSFPSSLLGYLYKQAYHFLLHLGIYLKIHL